MTIKELKNLLNTIPEEKQDKPVMIYASEFCDYEEGRYIEEITEHEKYFLIEPTEDF